jgi:PadR family transcriptional regulator, regulatory protein AphA
MSLDHALLGFLSEAPSTGYELKKRFDASVRHFWPADRTHIYRALNVLAERGFTCVEVVEQDGKPNQKRYSITESGKRELSEWLKRGLPAPEVREATLIQVFFGHLLPDGEAARMLEQQARALHELLTALQSIQPDARTTSGRRSARQRFFARLTLEHGIAMLEAELGFLSGALKRLAQQHKAGWR